MHILDHRAIVSCSHRINWQTHFLMDEWWSGLCVKSSDSRAICSPSVPTTYILAVRLHHNTSLRQQHHVGNLWASAPIYNSCTATETKLIYASDMMKQSLHKWESFGARDAMHPEQARLTLAPNNLDNGTTERVTGAGKEPQSVQVPPSIAVLATTFAENVKVSTSIWHRRSLVPNSLIRVHNHRFATRSLTLQSSGLVSRRRRRPYLEHSETSSVAESRKEKLCQESRRPSAPITTSNAI
jgi:hypothetical protein